MPKQSSQHKSQDEFDTSGDGNQSDQLTLFMYAVYLIGPMVAWYLYLHEWLIFVANVDKYRYHTWIQWV